MKGIRFHSKVMTPNGPGVVQGRLRQQGKPDKVLVSHQPDLFRPEAAQEGEAVSAMEKPAVWILYAYRPETVSLLEVRR